MQFIPGLVSVSFRQLSPAQIIAAARAAGLSAIEWGGDVHVPAGDTEMAKQIRAATIQAGLSMPEYGAYYRIGFSAPEEFDRAAACAHALGVQRIRVWGFNQGSADILPPQYDQIVRDARRICHKEPALKICLECHGHTVTDDYHAALRFLQDVDCPNLRMFWQPNQRKSHEENKAACEALLPYIESVHVFSWEKDQRFPLAYHQARWAEYMKILESSEAPEMYLMLEFMHDGSPDSLPETAHTLRQWIARL